MGTVRVAATLALLWAIGTTANCAAGESCVASTGGSVLLQTRASKTKAGIDPSHATAADEGATGFPDSDGDARGDDSSEFGAPEALVGEDENASLMSAESFASAAHDSVEKNEDENGGSNEIDVSEDPTTNEQVAIGGGFSVNVRRLKVRPGDAQPFVPIDAQGRLRIKHWGWGMGRRWGYGPGEHYGNYGFQKMFHPTLRSDGREGVIWQDQKKMHVYVTWLSSDMSAAETQKLYKGKKRGSRLAAVASNGNDQAILLLIREGKKKKGAKTDLVKISLLTGETLATNAMPAGRSGWAIKKFDGVCAASMVWNTQTGIVGAVVSRKMIPSHQAAMFVLLNAETLEVVRKGGMASHSLGNSISVASDNSFLAVDLGDNFPRGIQIKRLVETGRLSSAVPYTFKTRHATKAKNARTGVYEEISTAEKTFYKWSNDNNVYTELGRSPVIEVDDGLLVFFASETPSLDCTMAGKTMNTARNTGFVKIGKDLSSKSVLSGENEETGGYYTYSGYYRSQKNVGINWLTNQSSTAESVSRLKTAPMGNGKILLFWEIWSANTYKYSQMMVVDEGGGRVAGPWSVPEPVALAPSDDLFVSGGKAIAYVGSKADGTQLLRYEFSISDSE